MAAAKVVKIVSEHRPVLSLRSRVMDGGIDIMLDNFVYVSVNYDYRYTNNALRQVLAENIALLISGRGVVVPPTSPEATVSDTHQHQASRLKGMGT